MRIVDEHDCEVEPGAVGELLVRTDRPWAMNHGYNGKPEATARAWRNGWFHTGDAFREDDAGNYFFVDRMKDAIRRRGENISSFEVETEIGAFPGGAGGGGGGGGERGRRGRGAGRGVARRGREHRPGGADRVPVPRQAHFMVPSYVRVLPTSCRRHRQKVQKHLLRTEGVTAARTVPGRADRGQARARGRDDGAGRGTENTMTTDDLLIDCDGHILEPPDLWETYLEPRYRDRAIRIRVGDDAFEYLEIDGRRAVLPRQGQLGTLGGMGKRVDEAKELRERAMRGEIRPEEMRGIPRTPSARISAARGSAP